MLSITKQNRQNKHQEAASSRIPCARTRALVSPPLQGGVRTWVCGLLAAARLRGWLRQRFRARKTRTGRMQVEQRCAEMCYVRLIERIGRSSLPEGGTGSTESATSVRSVGVRFMATRCAGMDSLHAVSTSRAAFMQESFT